MDPTETSANTGANTAPNRFIPVKADPMIRVAAPLLVRLRRVSNGPDPRFAGRSLPQILGMLVNQSLIALETPPGSGGDAP